MSAENNQFFKAYGLTYLGVPEVLKAKGIIMQTSEVPMTFEKNGKQFTTLIKPKVSTSFPGKYGLIQNQGEWLDSRNQDRIPLWLKNIDKLYFFEYLDDSKTLYVRQSSIFNDEETERIVSRFIISV